MLETRKWRKLAPKGINGLGVGEIGSPDDVEPFTGVLDDGEG